jgi:hypothetical protein
MLIHVPESGTPCLLCEECGEVLRCQPFAPVIDLWRKHARECPLGCEPPPERATYLMLSRLA